MRPIAKCECEAQCETEIWRHNNVLYFRSVLTSNLTPISSFNVLGMINGEESTTPEMQKIIEAEYARPAQPLLPPLGEELTKEDVWGTFDLDKMERTSWGMVVARGLPSGTVPVAGDYPTTCPVWHDALPYKSVTVICTIDRLEEVMYWLTYVHGGGNLSDKKTLGSGFVALRSNYMAW